MPHFTIRAALYQDEAGEALDLVATGGLAVCDAIHLDELHRVTILGRELLDDLVPFGHELDAVAAIWHEKVDNNVLALAGRFDDVLEVVGTAGFGALSVFPPVGVVHCLKEGLVIVSGIPTYFGNLKYN